MQITPLHNWIGKKIDSNVTSFGRDVVDQYQFDSLQRIYKYVREKSPFYKNLYEKYPPTIESVQEFSQLPFTNANDIQQDPNQFICVSQNEIQRIVTLPTSGTSGVSKRVFFTTSDQELTIDFFCVGMSTLAKPGDRVLVLLPGQRPGSVGNLLGISLERLGCCPYIYGPVDDESVVLQIILENNINIIVGAPIQLHRLSAWDHAHSVIPHGLINKVLSSTDILPESIRYNLNTWWGCEVFDHYGMTETGLGGGVECEAHHGYHLREADLYFEVIDPQTGRNLEDGEHGELVFTSLTRTGMPLIRYRTGDISCLLAGDCICGSFIKRLEKINKRLSGGIPLYTGVLYPSELDEALFKLEGILDFSAVITHSSYKDILSLDVQLLNGDLDAHKKHIINFLYKNSTIYKNIENRKLKIYLSETEKINHPQINSISKRVILNKDIRETDP
jgi:phenylacetate-CoA ligase